MTPWEWMRNQHWFCVIPILPFLSLFAVHEWFGLSDSMLGVPVGQRPPSNAETTHNLLMGFSFWPGAFGYLWCACELAPRSTPWFLMKVAGLLLGFGLLYGYWQFTR